MAGHLIRRILKVVNSATIGADLTVSGSAVIGGATLAASVLRSTGSAVVGGVTLAASVVTANGAGNVVGGVSLTASTIATTGSTKLGGTANNSQFSATGRMTMAGTGRARGEVVLPATAFHPWGASSAGAGASVFATASYVFKSVQGATADDGNHRMPTISPSTTGSDARMNTTFFVPLDADTTGSVLAYVEMLQNAATSTPSSMGFTLRYNYMANGASRTTAGSVQGAIPALATADVSVGTRISGSLPALPSFGTVGDMIAIELQMHTGTCTAGVAYDFAGLRLRYTKSSLGVASSE